MDRKRFITSISRWLLAGGLLGTTGLLLYRREVGDPGNCFVNPYCKRCGKNNSCAIIAAANPDNNERKAGK